MNKQTLIFALIFLLFLGYLVTVKTNGGGKSNGVDSVEASSVDSDVKVDIIKKVSLPIKYDSILKGKWMRNDGVLVEYIPSPTNQFQVLNKTTDGNNVLFNVGEIKLKNLVCVDSINNIITCENSLSGVYDQYDDAKIRIIDGEQFMSYYTDAPAHTYTKVK